MAFGTGSVNKGHDVTAYVEQAIEAGFDHIDTATRQFESLFLSRHKCDVYHCSQIIETKIASEKESGNQDWIGTSCL